MPNRFAALVLDLPAQRDAAAQVGFGGPLRADLARLRFATGAADEARRLADEALLIADRSGYVLQTADAHLELARLAPDRPTARQHAAAAHRLATCDGPPDYTYAAAYAYADAESLLARLP